MQSAINRLAAITGIHSRARWAAWPVVAATLVIAISTWVGPWNGIADLFAAALPLAPALAVLAILLLVAAGRVPERPWLILTAAIAGFGSAMVVAKDFAQFDPARSGRRVVIVTHNIHHGGVSPQALASALARSGADILLLQENDGRSAGALDRLAQIYPYRDPCHACEQAILSRWPMSVHWRLPGRDGHAIGPALFRADVQVPGIPAPLRVITLHAPRRYWGAGQRPFWGSLIAALRQSQPSNLVIAGDFNLTPWTATMRHLERALAPLRRVTSAMPTYPSQLPLAPIDHIFVSDEISVTNVSTLSSTGSDHLPVRAVISLPIKDKVAFFRD